jgi:hypothetical protein
MDIDKGLLRAANTIFGANALEALAKLQELERQEAEQIKQND